jgi:hypothetical protein
MRWFGELWSARICETARSVETPVGARCFLCPEPIAHGDTGFVIVGFEHGVTAHAIAHSGCFTLSLIDAARPARAEADNRRGWRPQRQRARGSRRSVGPARERRRRRAVGHAVRFPISPLDGSPQRYR